MSRTLVEGRLVWNDLVVSLVLVLALLALTMVNAADDAEETPTEEPATTTNDDDTELQERSLFFQTKRKIREIICTGKASEEQLDKLTECWTKHKTEREPVSSKMEEWFKLLEESVARCVAEEQTDVTFEITKPENREVVFLFCSSNFKDCVDEKSPPFFKFRRWRTTTEATGEEDSNTTEEPKFDHEKHRKNIMDLMKCKREALGITR